MTNVAVLRMYLEQREAAGAETAAVSTTELRDLFTTIERLTAEVEMLRGVGCMEDGDGPCGCCVKCQRATIERQAGELKELDRDRDLWRCRAELAEHSWDVCAKEVDSLRAEIRAALHALNGHPFVATDGTLATAIANIIESGKRAYDDRDTWKRAVAKVDQESTHLREVAGAVVEAWESDPPKHRPGLDASVEALQTALRGGGE